MKRKRAPGAGRPKGAVTTEPTVPIPARVAVRVLEAHRERYGRGWAERLREVMEADSEGRVAVVPTEDEEK